MPNFWKVVVENDDGTESEYLVRQDLPLAVSVNDLVDKFTAFAGGFDILDDKLDPNWYVQCLCFLWALKKLNPDWEVGRLLGAGIQTIKSLAGVGQISAPTGISDLVIQIPLAYFPDGEHESLRRYDHIRFTLAGEDYTSRIWEVDVVGGNVELMLDPVQDFTGSGWAVPLGYPIAVTGLDAIVIEYRKLPQLDNAPLFFMDDPVKEQVDRFIQQIYDLFKAHLFAGKVDYQWLISQGRFDRLVEFLDRVRAVETNFVLCSDVPATEEDAVPAITELTPTDSANFITFLATLVIDQDYIETYVFGT